MSQFIKELTKPADPFYLRLIKGSNVTMPEFMNRGVFYTGTSGFNGTVVSNATNPLFDVKDYIYTSGTTSNLDFWGYNYTIPTGMLGKDASFKFNFKTSTSNFVVAAYALCTSGNKLIYTSQPITIGTSLYEAVFNIPTDCTGLKVGWQFIGTASGETFEYDNVIFSQWTPQAVNLSIEEAISYTGYMSKDGGDLIKFKTRDSIRSSFGNIINVDDTTYANHTRFNVLKPCNVTVTAAGYYASGAALIIIQHYNSTNTIIRQYQTQSSGSTIGTTTTQTIRANAGDYFVALSSTALVDSYYANFSITASAISENVVQSWQPSDFLGEIKLLPSTTAPKGFIPADGKSIGKTSGNYQGDAYYALYALRWAMASTTAGEPYVISSAKGASAQADWDAGKTITIDVRGMFFRAAGGDAGAVGSKQSDAFQGHQHTAYSSRLGSSIASGTSYDHAGSQTTSSIVTDGTNGTPRTASETRPINTSEYAYMRYGTSAPDLIALPTSKENVFSARIDASGNIISKSSDWIQSVTQSGTGNNIKTITFKSGIFTVAPSVTSMVEDASTSPSVYVSSASSLITSTTAVLTVYNDAGAIPSTNHGITIIAQKQSPDYTAPGVFVGNVQPEWQYDLNVTGTNWATTRAVGVVKKMGGGQYRLEFNIVGAINTSSALSLAVSGVTFKNVGPRNGQNVTTSSESLNSTPRSYASSNSNTINIDAPGGTVTGYDISGTVELESKPTWAVNTP